MGSSMEVSQKAENRSVWAWGDGFVGKAFSTEAWGPMFDPRSQINELGMVIYTRNSCVVQVGQGEACNLLTNLRSIINDF